MSPPRTREQLAAVFREAAETYTTTRTQHAQAMLAESKATIIWFDARGKFGVGSAQEIRAFATWNELREESQLAAAMLVVSRVALARAREAIPPAGGAQS